MPKDREIHGVKRRDGPRPAPSPALLQFLERKYPIHRIVQDDLEDRELFIAIGEQRVLAELRRLLDLEEEARNVPA